MNPVLDLDLPVGRSLPPPPPMAGDAFVEYWLRRLADFYKSPHFEAWEKRTRHEMQSAKAFVWVD